MSPMGKCCPGTHETFTHDGYMSPMMGICRHGYMSHGYMSPNRLYRQTLYSFRECWGELLRSSPFLFLLAESLYFQRMLGRATVLKSLVCIDRVSILSENVSIERVQSICGLSTPLFFLVSRGGSFCGHFYTTQGMMCASGLQTVSEARSSVRVLLHKCYL